ncbi:MAG: 23S rRNA (guanosine(2251)-2'-O)-methyltransferase RlmB [Patescibacteria group bacterium]
MAKDKKGEIFIYGKHVLTEALLNYPEAISQVFLDHQNRGGDLEKEIKKTGLKIFDFSPKHKTIKEQESHQGVIAKLNIEKITKTYDEFIPNLKISNKTGLVLLDEIQDPHNVGAIIRSAVAFGISGILIPQHRQAPLTGTIVKVSSGMAFRLPLVKIGNINQTIRDLQDRGFWAYALTGGGNTSLPKTVFDRPSVFIFGNEAIGIRAKTEETTDFKLSIPMTQNCESLNVSNAAAVTLYAWNQQIKNQKN